MDDILKPDVLGRIESDLNRLAGSVEEQAGAEAEAGSLRADVAEWLATVTAKPDSYRDAVLVLLAYPVISETPIDIRQRPVGARAVGDELGKKVLPALHIKGVVGAFQNIGKNSPEMVRGNNDAFDSALTWASTEAGVPELEIAYRYVVARVAATARQVQPRPKLRLSQLTFPRVMHLISALFKRPSGGAYEQYATAAL